MSITRYESGPRMSQAVVHGDTIYLSGIVADDTSDDILGQTGQVLDKIDALLAKAGSDKSKALTATIWLPDMAYFGRVNEIWDSWVDADHPPCQACVESRLALPEYLVEIMLTAAK